MKIENWFAKWTGQPHFNFCIFRFFAVATLCGIKNDYLWQKLFSMKNITSIVLAILCGMLVSCMKWGSRENSRLMQQAQLLVEQMPDSALTLLDAVNTFELNNAEKAEYTLLQVQARSNAGENLSSETEIFGARDYFVHKKDPQKAALACFYAALVNTYQNSDHSNG